MAKQKRDGPATVGTDWRLINPVKDYTDEDFILEGKRTIAVRRVGQALRNGTLRRSDTCQVCGEKCKTVGHHYRGYDYPFDVWWICRKCNAKLPHDGSMSLEVARSVIGHNLYRLEAKSSDNWKRWLYWQDWSQKQTGACGICGSLISLHVASLWDDILICPYCNPGNDGGLGRVFVHKPKRWLNSGFRGRCENCSYSILKDGDTSNLWGYIFYCINRSSPKFSGFESGTFAGVRRGEHCEHWEGLND